MENILSIQNLSKEYEGFTLNKVSFDLPKGCIMGLVGENGAGKTTIIKLILNLIKKDGGGVQVFGLDNIENDPKIKNRIGVVLDESNFHDNLKANDISNIMKSIYDSWDKELFSQYLGRFKLPKDKRMKDYSKGMKMKLSIAVALSHNPELLILDEPTGGLDPVVRSEILDIFLEFIQDEEKSILFSTHITSDLDKIADYITFIHNGSIIFTESKEELLDNYGIIKCGINDFRNIDKNDIIGYRKNQFGYEVLVTNKQRNMIKYRDFIMDNANLEDIMLFHIRGEHN
ncbi:MAG: ABC transporter ATP-binding protein [Tissierellaceae bacterium]|nr:ABC transporter ATP-binding protein [Tissierellaceae bacterium]